MVLDAVSNFVRGRVSAAVATSDTTVPVEDASIFPDPATDGEYNVVIWDANNFPRPDQDADVEIVRVTGRDTGADELTVVRGQETTSDVAHSAGSAVHLSPTAKMFSDIEAEYTAQGENFDGEGTSEFTNLQTLSTGSARTTDDSAITVDVPSDEPTLQDAIDSVSKDQLPDGTEAIVNIDSGHMPTAGLTVEDGYYGHVRITADDEIVDVADDFEGAFIRVFDGWGPTLATDIDMRDRGWDGVSGNGGGTAYVLGDVDGGSGVGYIEDGVTINNPERSGLRLFQTSRIAANNVTIDGSNYRPIHATHASSVSFREGTVRNSDMGVYASHKGKINAYNAAFEDISGDAVYANSGSVGAEGATFSNISGNDLTVVNSGQIIVSGGWGTSNIPPNTVQPEGVIWSSDAAENRRVKSGSYPGSNADERLSNALDDLGRGYTIELEDADYESNRTFDTRYRLTGGTGVLDSEQPAIRGEWTLGNRVRIDHVLLGGEATINVNDGSCVIRDTSGDATIEVNDDDLRFNSNEGHTVNVNTGGSGVAVGNVGVTINDPNDNFEVAGNS